MKKTISVVFLCAAILFLCVYVVAGIFKYWDNITYSSEIKFAKKVLIQPLLAKEPNQIWLNNVGGWSAENPESSFYIFKVWFAEAEVTRKHVEGGFLKFPAFRNEDKLTIDLFYKKYAPQIQCDIYSSPIGKKVNFSFPLNNCLFNPDYNSDDTINQDYVTLALEQLAKRNNRIDNVILFENLTIVSQLGGVFYSDVNDISWKSLPGNIIKIEIASNTLYSSMFVIDDKFGVYKINEKEFRFVYPEI